MYPQCCHWYAYALNLKINPIGGSMSCLNCGRNDSHDSDCFYDDAEDYEFSLDQKFEYYNTSSDDAEDYDFHDYIEDIFER